MMNKISPFTPSEDGMIDCHTFSFDPESYPQLTKKYWGVRSYAGEVFDAYQYMAAEKICEIAGRKELGLAVRNSRHVPGFDYSNYFGYVPGWSHTQYPHVFQSYPGLRVYLNRLFYKVGPDYGEFALDLLTDSVYLCLRLKCASAKWGGGDTILVSEEFAGRHQSGETFACFDTVVRREKYGFSVNVPGSQNPPRETPSGFGQNILETIDSAIRYVDGLKDGCWDYLLPY